MKWLRKIANYLRSLFVKKQIERVVHLGKSQAPSWMLVAEAEIGVREVSGSGNNPRIMDYHNATDMGSSPDSVPWCASFVNWCLARVDLEGTRKPNARSFLDWGFPMDTPELGCLVVFWRGSRTGWQGHVAFYVRTEGEYIYVLGGNQSDEVNVQAYHRSKLLGYRWPGDMERAEPKSA